MRVLVRPTVSTLRPTIMTGHAITGLIRTPCTLHSRSALGRGSGNGRHRPTKCFLNTPKIAPDDFQRRHRSSPDYAHLKIIADAFIGAAPSLHEQLFIIAARAFIARSRRAF